MLQPESIQDPAPEEDFEGRLSSNDRAASTHGPQAPTPVVPMDEATIRREHALSELKQLITSTLASKIDEIKLGITQRMLGQEVNSPANT